MLRDAYQLTDFDFALAYLEDLDLFYVFPVDVFISYGSEIHLVEAERRQRKPRSAAYRNAWHLISQYEASAEPLSPDSIERYSHPTRSQRSLSSPIPLASLNVRG